MANKEAMRKLTGDEKAIEDSHQKKEAQDLGPFYHFLSIDDILCHTSSPRFPDKQEDEQLKLFMLELHEKELVQDVPKNSSKKLVLDHLEESSPKRRKRQIEIPEAESEKTLEMDEFISRNDLSDESVYKEPFIEISEEEQMETGEFSLLEDAFDKLEEQNCNFVWDFFENCETQWKVICMYCKTEYSSSEPIFNLWKHLREYHKEKIVEPDSGAYLNTYYEFLLSENASLHDTGSKYTTLIWTHFEKNETTKATCIFCKEECISNNGNINSLREHSINNHEEQVISHALEKKTQLLDSDYEFLLAKNTSGNINSSELLQAYHDFLRTEERTVFKKQHKREIIWQNYEINKELECVVCIHCKKKYKTRNVNAMWRHLRYHLKEKICSDIERDQKLAGERSNNDDSLIPASKYTNSIWNYFERDGSTKPICVICKEICTDSVENLWSHLISNHEEQLMLLFVTSAVDVEKLNDQRADNHKTPAYGKSGVWNHFKKLSCQQVRCNYCKTEYKSIARVGVTLLRQHLIKRHGDIVNVEDLKNQVKSSAQSSRNKKPESRANLKEASLHRSALWKHFEHTQTLDDFECRCCNRSVKESETEATARANTEEKEMINKHTPCKNPWERAFSNFIGQI